MNGTNAIVSGLKSTQQLLAWYVGDFSDEDLLVRPVPEANHTAWQLGHLIGAEVGLLKPQDLTVNSPELPDGFLDKYTKETSVSDAKEDFLSKDAYLDLFNKCREANIAAVESMSDADLDKPTQGNMAQFAPRLGDLFILMSNHILMHAGQFTVVRRKLGKPVLF